jgi:FRG domain
MSEDQLREPICVTVPQFLQIILQNYWSEVGWVFRGQDNIDWPLRPKAGRDQFYLEATSAWVERGQSSSDLGRFNHWREQAVAYTDALPQNDFECLAFAQHYGLATRLLDWSTNPLVALYFAVEMQGETDGAVFCHMPWLIIDRKNSSIDREFDRAVLLTPRPFDRRIAAQSGVFTFHFHPERALTAAQVNEEARGAAPDGVDLVAIRVPAKAKPIFLRQLNEMGINRKYLFPDLEGLSAFVNWETRRTVHNRGTMKGQRE